MCQVGDDYEPILPSQDLLDIYQRITQSEIKASAAAAESDGVMFTRWVGGGGGGVPRCDLRAAVT